MECACRQAGFVTICIKNKRKLFGEVINEKMTTSAIGEITQQFWLEIPRHFPFVVLDEYQIMPDHLHGIIGISCKQTNK